MIPGIVASGSTFVPIVTPAMLDPLNSGDHIVLSNLNLTATKTTGGVQWEMSRSTYGPAAGKYYFEATFDEFSGSFVGVGLGDSTASVGNFYGVNEHGIIMINNGEVYANGALITTLASATEGQVVGIAFDIDAELVWFRTEAGNWNNSGTADPTTGTGGIAFGTLMGGVTFPGVGVQTSPSDQVTANFGPTFAHTPPTGYGIVGEFGYPTISGLSGITVTQ